MHGVCVWGTDRSSVVFSITLVVEVLRILHCLFLQDTTKTQE